MTRSSYTVIGTKGRIENVGDGPGSTVKVWTARTDAYRQEGDQEITTPEADDSGHGGADPLAHCRARALRPRRRPDDDLTGGGAVDVRPLDPGVLAWLDRGQTLD